MEKQVPSERLQDGAPERLRRAETVLHHRTGTLASRLLMVAMAADMGPVMPVCVGCIYVYTAGRIVLVLEQCMDSHNHQAVLRTAEGKYQELSYWPL